MSEALKKELIFYGSYHSDAINKLIHAICVPLLLWTGRLKIFLLVLELILKYKLFSPVTLDLTVTSQVWRC